MRVYVCVSVRACLCMYVCVRACVRACVRVRLCAVSLQAACTQSVLLPPSPFLVNFVCWPSASSKYAVLVLPCLTY